MCDKTFKQLYEEEKNKATPAQSFIANIAEITHRSKNTVKMWLVGRQSPDELAKSIIAKAYNCKAESLFPKNK